MEDSEKIFNATKVKYVGVYNAVVEVLNILVETIIFYVVIKRIKEVVSRVLVINKHLVLFNSDTVSLKTYMFCNDHQREKMVDHLCISVSGLMVHF